MEKIEITYSNHFLFNGRKLAFRNKLLFDITESTPIYIEFSGEYWLVKNKKLSKLQAKSLIINDPIIVDLSNLQWYQQIQLDKCFNLN